jgi:hypothetical protein
MSNVLSNPALQLAIKMIVSGVFVGLITEAAKRLPSIGGLIAALPIISLTSIIWLRIDGQSNGQIAHFVDGILYGLIPTTSFLVIVKVLLEREVHVAVAVGVGLVALAVVWFVVRALVA